MSHLAQSLMKKKLRTFEPTVRHITLINVSMLIKIPEITGSNYFNFRQQPHTTRVLRTLFYILQKVY
jgi:hypothetical protein